MNQRILLSLIVVAQTVLLCIELGTVYDTSERQIALSITNIVGTLGLLWINRWLRRRGGHISTWTFLLVMASLWIDALGNFQHWYGAYWWWDRVTHAIGGMAVSAVFIDLFLAHGAFKTYRHLAVWFGFLLGQFVAAMYEVSEWLGDWWFATERVRGPFDAPRDLLFNLLGGLVVVGLFWFARRGKGYS